MLPRLVEVAVAWEGCDRGEKAQQLADLGVDLWASEASMALYKAVMPGGAKLYDKFVNFTDDLLKVGEHLERASKSYDDARRKLSEGNGNLVAQVKALESLGVKARKKLAPELLLAAGEEDIE